MTWITKENKDKIINFLFKRTNLYTWVGRIFAIGIVTELSANLLPSVLEPNYSEIAKEYGYFCAVVLAFFIAKYFAGIWAISLLIKLTVLYMCFRFNLKLQLDNKDYVFIKSWNFGIGNSNVTNINYSEKETKNGKENN